MTRSCSRHTNSAIAVVLTSLALGSTIGASTAAAQVARPNAAGVSWGHIHLNVSDIEQHTQIWTEHFGGHVVDFDLVHTISLPNTTIMLNERPPTGGTQGSSVDHFGFSVPDVAAFLERWRADGLEVAGEFDGFDGRPQAYVMFPDGIRVELEEVPSLEVPAVPYHVHLYTDDDPEALRDWFVESFSLAPRPRGNNPFTADAPGMNVSFSPSDDAREPSQGRGVDHVGFEVDNLKEFTEALTARGVAFDVEYRLIEDAGLAIAFFTDASGTRWELTEGLDDLVGSAPSLPPVDKVRNYLPHMTRPEVQELLTRSDMVIIPVASLEQHGLHLPIGTDYLNGVERAKLIAQQVDVLVAPILLPGQSPYHMGFEGTISLPSSLIQEVYVEAAKSLMEHGFKRFLLLNAHGGNAATTRFIVDRINQETPGIAVDLGSVIGPFRPDRPITATTDDAPPAFDRHGGTGETSNSLYLTPDLVNLGVAIPAELTLPPHMEAMLPAVVGGDPTALTVFLAEGLKDDVTGKGTSAAEMSSTGVWGVRDPAEGTVERGRIDTESLVAASVAFIRRWNELRPPGTR
jgi:creatinine amidohydrolase